MRHVTFYHKESGKLHGLTVLVSDDSAIANNTPPDHIPLDQPPIGMHDPLSQRVDVETGKVIDFIPPAPSDQHEWNPNSKRWVLSAAAQARNSAARAAAARLHELISQQHSFVRRLILDPTDASARTALAAIDAEANSLTGNKDAT